MAGTFGDFVTSNHFNLNGAINREILDAFRQQVDSVTQQNNWPRIQWERARIETDPAHPDRIMIIDPQTVRMMRQAPQTRPPSLGEALGLTQRMEFVGEQGMWFDGQNPWGIPPPSRSQEAMYGPPPVS